MEKWIVIANRVSARIYSEDSFRHIKTLRNPMGKEKNRSFTYGKPGVGFANFSGSMRNHALDHERSPSENVAVVFAGKIKDYIKKQFALGSFDSLLIVAEPKMLGRIRKKLPADILRQCTWLQKDFGHVPKAELPKRLNLHKRATA